MTSNFMFASYGRTQGWLYEVLVYDIDYSLKLNGCSRSKDDRICLSYSMWAVWTLEFLFGGLSTACEREVSIEFRKSSLALSS